MGKRMLALSRGSGWPGLGGLPACRQWSAPLPLLAFDGTSERRLHASGVK